MRRKLPEASESKKVFLIGNQLTHEGITARISSLGHSYEIRNPLSSPSNWSKFVRDLNQSNNSNQLLNVFLLLSERVILRCCSPQYAEVLHELLMEMKQIPSLIFVYADNLSGTFTSIEEIFSLRKEPFSNSSFSRRDSRFIVYYQEEGALKTLKRLKIYIDDVEQLLQKTQKEETITEKVLDEIEASYNSANLFLYELKKHEKENQLLLSVQKEAERAERIFEKAHSLIVAQLYEREEVKKAKQFLREIQASGIEVVPYKTNVEIIIRIQQFLDEEEKGVFLHLYVPNGCFQAEQLASFLRLFENYLTRVENLQFAIDSRRTQHGLVYLFKSKNDMSSLTDMEGAFTRFGTFMDLCRSDPKKAEAIIVSTGIPPTDASNLITKYIKDYQRLLLDTKHELEQKRLALQQRFESEVFELASGSTLSVPQTVQPYAFLSLTKNSGSVNINILNSTVNNNPVIESQINGDIHYTSEDKQLIELFQKYTEDLEVIRLKSELEQLKDTSSPEDVRKTAKQKVVGFLYKVAPAIGQTALTVLTAYLEKLLTGA